MREALYILTDLIPSKTGFEAYFKDLETGETRREKRELYLRKRYENIPAILQYFIENNTYPLSIYDSKLNQVGRMSFNSFQDAISKRCLSLDIEVLNPNRIPDPRLDEIVCVSYGNDEFVVMRFNGKNKTKVGENYIVHFDEERNLLQKIFEDLSSSQDFFLCGYNILDFDLRYIKERAKLLGIQNEIKNYTTKNLFNNRKTAILPNFINIDLLPILQFASLPSTKLEYVAKFFGLDLDKMPIEELWVYYNRDEFDDIIEHNVGDVITTHKILNKLLPSIYLLSEKTIGTFNYGFYSNLPRNIMTRTLLNHFKKKNYKIEEILEIVNRELNKISFTPKREKIGKKSVVKYSGKFNEGKLLDLGLILGEKLKKYNSAFEELLKTHEEIEPSSTENALSRRIISGVIYKLVLGMRKKTEYRKEIDLMLREILENVDEKIYYSSGRFIVASDFKVKPSFPIFNLILNSKPKIFLANCEGILIGSIPKKPVGMPEGFFKSFIQDLFDMVLENPIKEMQTMKEKLEKRDLRSDDLKLEVRGVDYSQLSRDSKKKIFVDEVMKRKTEPRERRYVVKLEGGFVSLEDARKTMAKVDFSFYEEKFQEFWKIYEKIRRGVSQKDLDYFFDF